MSITEQYQAITPSGKGVRITDRKVTDFTKDELQALLDKYLWIAFKNNPITIEDVEATLTQFGPLTQNDRRKGVVLNIDASKIDAGEVLLGQGFLPLHRDGSLMGTDVRYVGIFCTEYKNVVDGGRTFIVDTEGAMADMPKDILDLLRERGIEGKPVDSYYLKSGDEWHPIAGMINVEGKEFLNIGFPSPRNEKPSWLMRIPGVDETRFNEIFDLLNDIVMSEKYCYYQDWNEGDLLLLDNRKTLHGREAFKGQRKLANIQVLAS
jgi:(5R)-carbapenem-3-carboxylate synthase